MKGRDLATAAFALACFSGGGYMIYEGLHPEPPVMPDIAAPVEAPATQTPVGPTKAAVDPLDTKRSLEDSSPQETSMEVKDMANGTLFIPAANVYTRLDPAFGEIKHGTLTLPDAERVTRWKDGAKAGDAQGHILISGHISMGNTRGGLYNLASTKAGNLAYLKDEGGKVYPFQLESMRSYKKQALPSKGPENVWKKDGPLRLLVITCGGELHQVENGSWHFDSNIVATFKPLGEKAPSTPGKPLPSRSPSSPPPRS